MSFWDFADKHAEGIFFILFIVCVVVGSVVESICNRNRPKEEKEE